MPNYPPGTTPEQLHEERAEQARRVTQGYEIRELEAMPTGALTLALLRVQRLEEAAALTVRGYRRWKRNQKRGGDRNEAENGMTDLGQGVWELAKLLEPRS